jgi:hypothetical protein
LVQTLDGIRNFYNRNGGFNSLIFDAVIALAMGAWLILAAL